MRAKLDTCSEGKPKERKWALALAEFELIPTVAKSKDLIILFHQISRRASK